MKIYVLIFLDVVHTNKKSEKIYIVYFDKTVLQKKYGSCTALLCRQKVNLKKNLKKFSEIYFNTIKMCEFFQNFPKHLNNDKNYF